MLLPYGFKVADVSHVSTFNRLSPQVNLFSVKPVQCETCSVSNRFSVKPVQCETCSSCSSFMNTHFMNTFCFNLNRVNRLQEGKLEV